MSFFKILSIPCKTLYNLDPASLLSQDHGLLTFCGASAIPLRFQMLSHHSQHHPSLSLSSQPITLVKSCLFFCQSIKRGFTWLLLPLPWLSWIQATYMFVEPLYCLFTALNAIKINSYIYYFSYISPLLAYKFKEVRDRDFLVQYSYFST